MRYYRISDRRSKMVERRAGESVHIIVYLFPPWAWSKLSRLYLTGRAATQVEVHDIDLETAMGFVDFFRKAKEQGIADLDDITDTMEDGYTTGRVVAHLLLGKSWDDVVMEEDVGVMDIVKLGDRRYLLPEAERLFGIKSRSGFMKVIQAGSVEIMFSYLTPVAIHLGNNMYAKTEFSWSHTTNTHINKFIDKYGAMERPQEWFYAYVENVLREYNKDNEEPLDLGPF